MRLATVPCAEEVVRNIVITITEEVVSNIVIPITWHGTGACDIHNPV